MTSAISLAAGLLVFDGLTLLSDVPASVQTISDPGGTGVFLRFEAEKASDRAVFEIGRFPALKRFVLCHRYDPWWNKPRFGTSAADVPPETQFLLAELSDGRCAAFFPLLDGAFHCAMEGDVQGVLHLVAESGDPAIATASAKGLFVAVGQDPYALVRASATSIRDFMDRGRLRSEKPVPDFVDYFGWCTWDAFYGDVSHDKVRAGLESFARGGVPPRLLILDDGWLSMEKNPATGENRLTGFEANDKFPGGLRATADMAKGEFGVSVFIVWHALEGYWGGIDPASFTQYRVVDERRSFSPGLRHHTPDIDNAFGPIIGVVAPEDIHRFYHDFHRFLREQGVDGVKVDNQGSLEGVSRGLGGRVELMRRYHEALEGAANTHFQGRVINCMSQSTDVIYQTLASNVTRSFTDFWPADPASHGLHLVANAQISLWFGEFVFPDWDMFQSGHGMGAYHAAGRAVSGGPVYVSDKPDGHDFALLRKLVCSDGTILRARDAGRPTRDCLFVDTLENDIPFKIFNRNDRAGIVGVFHTRYAKDEAGRRPASGTTCAADVEELEGDDFAVYAHNAGTLARTGRDDTVPFQLPPLGFELFSFVPVEGGFAPIGLADKFNSAGAVLDKQVGPDGVLRFGLRDGGDLLVWAAAKPSRLTVDGLPADFAYDAATGAVRASIPTTATPHAVEIAP
ncbi:MAG: Sip1-related alpha-galactosidase [Kiritimatiellia bacterium]